MNCPLCGSKDTKAVYIKKNASFANNDKKMDLVIELCGSCSFVFQSSAYSDMYDRVAAEVYENFTKNKFFTFPNRTSDNIKAVNLIIDNVSHIKNPGILEIGSNRGDLLFMLKEKIPTANVLGLDPANIGDVNVPTIKSFFNKSIFSNKFDVIIMQQVLEHIKFPGALLQDVKDIMSEDGLLYLEMPYLHGALFDKVEDFLLEHVNYFSLKSIKNILGGLKLPYYDTRPFLKVIAKRRGPELPLPAEAQETERLFNDLAENKKRITEEIRALSHMNKKIVFYGVSYYFKILFKEIKELLKEKTSFYYDDSYVKPMEEEFALPRLSQFDDNCVVIICSTNAEVQDRIEKRLSQYEGITIIRPWSRIYINKRSRESIAEYEIRQC